MNNKEKEIKERIEKIKGLGFIYDNCHKIYILETNEDVKEAVEKNKNDNYYTLYPMEKLAEMYLKSCPLRFINNYKLTKTFIEQGEYDNF
jgi:hypothetical protein